MQLDKDFKVPFQYRIHIGLQKKRDLSDRFFVITKNQPSPM